MAPWERDTEQELGTNPPKNVLDQGHHWVWGLQLKVYLYAYLTKLSGNSEKSHVYLSFSSNYFSSLAALTNPDVDLFWATFNSSLPEIPASIQSRATIGPWDKQVDGWVCGWVIEWVSLSE